MLGHNPVVSLFHNTPVVHTHQMSFCVLSLNVCGIKSKFSSVDFVDLMNKYDVICFTETKCDDVDMINAKDIMENNVSSGNQ